MVRLVMPAELIRRLDEALLQGLGGFETRAEFVREAVENTLLELTYEPAPPEPSAGGRLAASNETNGLYSGTEDEDASVAILTTTSPELETSDLSIATALATPTRGATISDGAVRVTDEPLFGIHNRDYPSFWAAAQIANVTRETPVPLSSCVDEVVRRAWTYAERLRLMEQLKDARKLTVMFPTNAAKRQSAEGHFRNFVVGGVSDKGSNGIVAWGPLFSWRVCQVQRDDGGELSVALTENGYELLEKMEGISLRLPHPPEKAELFFEHLRRHAPEDWRVFEDLLGAVADEPDRTRLVSYFEDSRKEWTSTVASTNSQGYVGRAREWGLIEPKQVKGRYVLTGFGREVLEGRR